MIEAQVRIGQVARGDDQCVMNGLGAPAVRFPLLKLGSLSLILVMITPLKTNMSPENQWLEDVFPTKIVPF